MPIMKRNFKKSTLLLAGIVTVAFYAQTAIAQSCTDCASDGTATITDRTPSPCTADGYCTPKAGTWGKYPVRWRKWPTQTAAGGPSSRRPVPPALAPKQLPTPEQEDKSTPTPAAPRVQLPAKSTTDASPAPAVGEGARIQHAIPSAPMNSPSNPFHVTPTSMESTIVPKFETVDPPPALPASLWSLHQTKVGEINVRLSRVPIKATLPRIARLPMTVQQANPVRQASASVPADKHVVNATGDSKAVAEEVVPAVHFAPLSE